MGPSPDGPLPDRRPGLKSGAVRCEVGLRRLGPPHSPTENLNPRRRVSHGTAPDFNPGDGQSRDSPVREAPVQPPELGAVAGPVGALLRGILVELDPQAGAVRREQVTLLEGDL